MKTIFEKSVKGRCAVEFKSDVPFAETIIPGEFLRDELELPELSEVDIIRHYTALSRMNFGVDTGFYPLGSCTMKYNPKINEDIAKLNGFSLLHPYSPESLSQGSLQVLCELEQYLCEITGMDKFSLQPAAGAHGELAGVMIIKKYFEAKGQKRTKMLIPDSAHGTNPATVSLCGFEAVQLNSNAVGEVDLNELRKLMTEEVAGLMITNPNTLGLFDRNIIEIADIVHRKGGVLYCDGANANAVIGVAKFSDMGIDILHLNLHKTFSTPHGSGGPGSGSMGVKKYLAAYLPLPTVEKKKDIYRLNYENKESIGRVKAFYGNFGVILKAYSYIMAIGAKGIRQVAENAVLNANYMMAKLKSHYNLPYNRVCKHEFVLNDDGMPNGITTADIAKRLLDYGFHAPTIYFPLIVHGAMVIEPTETESKETMDSFIDAMIKIKEDAKENPELLRKAPLTTPVGRVDAVLAARKPDLRWKR